MDYKKLGLQVHAKFIFFSGISKIGRMNGRKEDNRIKVGPRGGFWL